MPSPTPTTTSPSAAPTLHCDSYYIPSSIPNDSGNWCMTNTAPFTNTVMDYCCGSNAVSISADGSCQWCAPPLRYFNATDDGKVTQSSVEQAFSTCIAVQAEDVRNSTAKRGLHCNLPGLPEFSAGSRGKGVSVGAVVVVVGALVVGAVVGGG